MMLFSLLMGNHIVAQDIILDTLRYYESDENELYWIDDCEIDGYCEPVAVRYDQEDLPVNTIEISKIRFKIVAEGDYRCELYSGGGENIPLVSNLIWDDSINVNASDVHVDSNGVSAWKEIEFGEYGQPLFAEFPVWFKIETKTYNLGFSASIDGLDAPSQTISGWLVDGSQVWVEQDGSEFICDLVVSYSPSMIFDVGSNSIKFSLMNAFPNPFNPSTMIPYELSEQSNVMLEIYNTHGQSIQTLVSETQSTGLYSTQWFGADANGKLVPSGMYFARLQIGKQSDVVKIVLLR
ncbi:MAG: T9SS type A sorting domain-containing protein [Bacteroidota bacterium]|nr:T9SS type A sorting domain-containing protein [Bacteroidota bacterium]